MSSAWEIKDQLFDAYNDHELGRIVDYYRPDAVLVTPVGVAEGHDQIASCYEQQLTAFPDLRVTPWYKVPYDDPAITEWVLTGTFTGSLLLPDGHTVQGNGRHVAVRGSCAAHIENDKVVTHREYYDQLELYSQLGFRLMSEPIA